MPKPTFDDDLLFRLENHFKLEFFAFPLYFFKTTNEAGANYFLNYFLCDTHTHNGLMTVVANDDE